MTLREQVAEVIGTHSDYDDGWDEQADAAIRVVLAAVAEQVTARCDMLLHGAYGDDAMHELGAALAAVARLGEEA